MMRVHGEQNLAEVVSGNEGLDTRDDPDDPEPRSRAVRFTKTRLEFSCLAF